MTVDNSYVIFLDIICAFIVHTFLLSPPPMFFRETRYCIIYFLYSSSAVIWTMQPDACFFRFVLRSVWMTLSSASVRHTSFEVTENTKQCLLLLTIFFYLLQCSVGNCKHNYMVIYAYYRCPCFLMT